MSVVGQTEEAFVDDDKSALRAAYPREPWGTVFPFARVFAVARRTD